MTAADPAGLRDRRAALVADRTRRGPDFGRALADAIDDAVRATLRECDASDVAVVALGSYARRELCPGSDVDILLVHDGHPGVAGLADALWYPLWDAGLVLGHATRTPKESRRLAAKDRDTLTALLDGRVVGGGAPALGHRVIDEARRQAVRDRAALLERLAADAALRTVRPGPVAEMLEPNLKDGAGGLRDLHALHWAGWCHGGPAVAGLVATGALEHDDVVDLESARAVLLDTRVALHRATGTRSDVLALQEQDAVAVELRQADADALVRALATAARRVAWLVADVLPRLGSAGAGRRSAPARVDGPFVEYDGCLGIVRGGMLDGDAVVALARRAAERGLAIDRTVLRAGRHAPPPTWRPAVRDDFVGLLRTGRAAVSVVAALDHGALMTRLLPEWEGVQARPQRNAYHRFTVDRHLIETVAEAASLLDDDSARAMAAELRRPDVLLLGALLHDIAKGRPGDHSEVGAEVARDVATRLGLDDDGVDALVWLVRDHLLMADTATRRDLADPTTISKFATRVGDAERLRLLTLLTIADSRATGPAAWSTSKAALVQELFARTSAWWSGEHVAVAGAPSAGALPGPGVVVEWTDLADGRLRCAVGADDRPGLLAGVAGALSLEGFDIDAAEGHSRPGGRAAEVFDGTDPLGRLGDDAGRQRAAETIRGVLAGRIEVDEGLRVRRAAYRSAPIDPAALRVVVEPDASAAAIVVEVYAPDGVGLLATLARAFFDARLDVTSLRAATTGELAVDVFYVRDDGSLADSTGIAGLDRALRDALTRD